MALALNNLQWLKSHQTKQTLRDSGSLLRFSFLGHIEIFSRAISPVCPSKYPYRCFSLHFCFPVFVFVV